ncbi:hypothetical protein B0H11DRAFT_2213333 [Mycena galericulata]|nr:hypothetical protein B0H11DRAFT_2213333 [Mycena galericulata]
MKWASQHLHASERYASALGRALEPGTFQCTTRRDTAGRGTGCIARDDDDNVPIERDLPDPCPPCGHLDSTTFWLPASSASEIKRRRTRSDANQRRLLGFTQSTRICDISAKGVRGGVR